MVPRRSSSARLPPSEEGSVKLGAVCPTVSVIVARLGLSGRRNGVTWTEMKSFIPAAGRSRVTAKVSAPTRRGAHDASMDYGDSGAARSARGGCRLRRQHHQGPAGPRAGGPGRRGRHRRTRWSRRRQRAARPQRRGVFAGRTALGPAAEGVPASAPLSSMVALTFCDAANTGADQHRRLRQGAGRQYGRERAARRHPVPAAAGGHRHGARDRRAGARRGREVARSADLGPDRARRRPRASAPTPTTSRYFGDGWQDDGTPHWQGSDTAGWVWVNHEYVSNGRPRTDRRADRAAPRRSPGSSRDWGTHRRRHHRQRVAPTPISTSTSTSGSAQVGGSWMHVVQDPATGELGRRSPRPRGATTPPTRPWSRSPGTTSPPTTTTAASRCPRAWWPASPATARAPSTPWGTVITAEENVQDDYGDLEPAGAGQPLPQPARASIPAPHVALRLAPSPSSPTSAPPAATALAPARTSTATWPRSIPAQAPDEYYGKTTRRRRPPQARRHGPRPLGERDLRRRRRLEARRPASRS